VHQPSEQPIRTSSPLNKVIAVSMHVLDMHLIFMDMHSLIWTCTHRYGMYGLYVHARSTAYIRPHTAIVCMAYMAYMAMCVVRMSMLVWTYTHMYIWTYTHRYGMYGLYVHARITAHIQLYMAIVYMAFIINVGLARTVYIRRI
jgi:hypothetical protein